VAVQWKPCCFNPGVPTFYSIVECVNNPKKTLVILSPNALESVWPLLEVEQALEQSKKRNYLTLRILLHNVTDQHILHLKRGIFASLPSFKLDFNSPSWEQNLVDEINSKNTFIILYHYAFIAFDEAIIYKTPYKDPMTLRLPILRSQFQCPFVQFCTILNPII
jgi:hypothetical protein